MEFVQQDLLVVRRVGDAAAAEFRAGAGRQHHIHQPEFAQFIQHAPRFVPQAGLAAELASVFHST